MFIHKPGKASPAKRIVYLIASTIMGILLSFIVHALFEICYLRAAQRQGVIVPFYGGCAFPTCFQVVLVALGAVGGFLIGRTWWRIIYVDKIWAKKSK